MDCDKTGAAMTGDVLFKGKLEPGHLIVGFVPGAEALGKGTFGGKLKLQN